MSKELIAALEHCENMLMRHSIDAVNGEAIEDEALSVIRSALSRHRSSVESVEFFREADCWIRRNPGFSSGVAHMGKEKPFGWPGAEPFYTASTVRSLIAAAVEREREECAKVCEDMAAAAAKEVGSSFEDVGAMDRCAAAIRSRGEMK